MLVVCSSKTGVVASVNTRDIISFSWHCFEDQNSLPDGSSMIICVTLKRLFSVAFIDGTLLNQKEEEDRFLLLSTSIYLFLLWSRYHRFH